MAKRGSRRNVPRVKITCKMLWHAMRQGGYAMPRWRGRNLTVRDGYFYMAECGTVAPGLEIRPPILSLAPRRSHSAIPRCRDLSIAPVRIAPCARCFSEAGSLPVPSLGADVESWMGIWMDVYYSWMMFVFIHLNVSSTMLAVVGWLRYALAFPNSKHSTWEKYANEGIYWRRSSWV